MGTPTEPPKNVTRRGFLKWVTAGVAGLAVGGAAGYAAPRPVAERTIQQTVTATVTKQAELKKLYTPAEIPVPTSPLKLAHQTIFTGAGAVLGEPSWKGALLAVKEINATGGILGKRKIDIVQGRETTADESVKEFKRLVLDEKIDVFTGIISSGVTPAIGPVAEELGTLTLFTDGCTDFLFEQAVPKPHFTFRFTNIQSADGTTGAVGAARLFPDAKRIAHIHPDYAYGRNANEHFRLAFERLVDHPVEVAFEAFPGLFRVQDFGPFITSIINAKPDLIVSSLWGGDYIAFYKQGVQQGLFTKARRFASMISFGVAPHAIGTDHPQGTIAGHHANYYFTYPDWKLWPINGNFVGAYFKEFNEYPNFEAEGAYVSVYAYKAAVERAAALRGVWPDVDQVIQQLEGLRIAGPAGYYHIRPENHQAYKNAVTGVSKLTPQYSFPIVVDQIHIPIEKVTAPPGWPRGNESTAAANWIKNSWPKAA